jgi:flagellar basal-body rod modification protein FlgD
MSSAVSSAGGISDYIYVGKSKDASIKVSSETFLKLLVAQLQYQDPLEPQSNTEMVSELAQMSQMEQAQISNQYLSSSQGYNLIGKYAYAEVLNSLTGITEQYFGQVESVVVNKGITYAVMGNYAINLDNISQVFDSSVIETDAQQPASAD